MLFKFRRIFWVISKLNLDRVHHQHQPLIHLHAHNFSKFLSVVKPVTSFSIPNWIPSLAQPSILYDLSPYSYQQITQVICRMKASGSPCLLDRISIIPFKHWPYL